MSGRIQKTTRLNLVGSIIFGALLFGAGYGLGKFIDSLDDQTTEQAIMGGRVALGMMIFGGIIVVGNLLWTVFIVITAMRKPPLN